MINNIKVKDIAPFIVLPQGNMQEILYYYSSSSLRSYEYELLNLANRNIGNTFISYGFNYFIRVYSNYKYIVVFHIYPSNVKETISDRYGQKVIIGYVINKFWFNLHFNSTVSKIESFFEFIKKYNCENSSSKDFIINNLLRNSSDAIWSMEFINKMQNTYYDTIRNLNTIPHNKLLIDLYKDIRRRAFFHTRWCYIRINDSIELIPDNQLLNVLSCL